MTRKILFSIIIFAVFLTVTETVCRFAERILFERFQVDSAPHPGWQTTFFGSIFDWHEPDPDLLWRFKAGISSPFIETNSQHLIGPPVNIEKPDGVFRILLLGDSSPVGLGLESYHQGFGALLERSLNGRAVGTERVEVINAAVSGYSSEQIRCFLSDRGWDYEPDMVIVYCGNNDASISGSLSDRELLNRQSLKSLRKGLAKTATYRMLRAMFMQLPKPHGNGPDELCVRVSAERFGENLRVIATECADRECPLIILKPPVPLNWPAGLQFKVFTNVSGGDGELILPPAMAEILSREVCYCLESEGPAAIHDRADKFTKLVFASAYEDDLPLPEARKRYSGPGACEEGDAVACNNLGVALWRESHYAEARDMLQKAREFFLSSLPPEPSPARAAAGAVFLFNLGINELDGAGVGLPTFDSLTARGYLDSALQADFFSLRIKDDYLDRIDSLKELKSVYVVDFGRIFDMMGGDGLFIDHCHPTEQGHRIIAGEICRRIEQFDLVR